jgi:hypothetical protein
MYEEFANLAGAIAASLTAASNGGAFALTFNESRVLWSNRRIELSEPGVFVDVAPVNWEQLIESRGSWEMDCHYDVGVRKRIETADQDPATGFGSDEEIKGLIKLLSDLLGHFLPVPPDGQGLRFPDIPEACWIDQPHGKTPVTIVWDDLVQLHQFTGFFPVTYRVTRDVP